MWAWDDCNIWGHLWVKEWVSASTDMAPPKECPVMCARCGILGTQ